MQSFRVSIFDTFVKFFIFFIYFLISYIGLMIFVSTVLLIIASYKIDRNVFYSEKKKKKFLVFLDNKYKVNKLEFLRYMYVQDMIVVHALFFLLVIYIYIFFFPQTTSHGGEFSIFRNFIVWVYYSLEEGNKHFGVYKKKKNLVASTI